MTEPRAPYTDAPEKWKEDVIGAVRSPSPDALIELHARWRDMGYTPRLIVRCMEFPYIVLELSESERFRLAEAIRQLDRELESCKS
jgi:hypothetical protein